MANRPLRLGLATVGLAALVGGAAVSRALPRSGQPIATTVASAAAGARPEQAPSVDQGMLWKYLARCALKEGQTVEDPDGHPVTGALGLAPEWQDGVCDAACQEKVSACLFSLTNPTGKHVQLGLLGNDPSLPSTMHPTEADLPYVFQEGAFFGNVFTGEAFVCRGRDAARGAAVKRWCAIEPRLCNVLAPLQDAGTCEQSCDMTCSRLSDGSQRCVASRCRDPRGHVWSRPITIFLRDRIEAGNADEIVRAVSRNEALEHIQDGGTATFREVDFGPATPGRRHGFLAQVKARRGGGRIEIWLGNQRRLGVLPVKATGPRSRDLMARLSAADVSGRREVVLRFAGLDRETRIETIAVR